MGEPSRDCCGDRLSMILAGDAGFGYMGRLMATADPAGFPSRAARIDAALQRRNYSPALRDRIERLLDGSEDRERLRCCNSGCYVCANELRAIVAEIEGGGGSASASVCSR